LVHAFQYLDPNNKLIPSNKLSPETASYWRNLATYLHNESEVKGVASATPFLEELLPELTHFCGYVRIHLIENHPNKNQENPDQTEKEGADAKEMAWLFNGKQLIGMISLFDLADVVSN
jgi:hypothetical protein